MQWTIAAISVGGQYYINTIIKKSVLQQQEQQQHTTAMNDTNYIKAYSYCVKIYSKIEINENKIK